MAETPQTSRRLRQPSPRLRRLEPRLPDNLIAGTDRRVHAVVQELPNDRLDEEKLKIISDALRGMQFKAPNLSFEEYSNQTPDERGTRIDIIETLNRDWISTALSVIADVSWIQVENDRVTAAGGRNSMPDSLQIYAEGEKKGFIPFVFHQEIEVPLE